MPDIYQFHRPVVSTHDLTKRSTLSYDKYSLYLTFQLTTSRRGRLRHRTSPNRLCTFQLTTSRRGRLRIIICFTTRTSVSTHDLTKRSTIIVISVSSFLHVSTHDLTKRSTTVTVNTAEIIVVSTHDLTKRSTLEQQVATLGAEVFQLTTSRRGRQYLVVVFRDLTGFNSRPHEEVDMSL